MTEYCPDAYQFLRISSTKDNTVVYKLFAVWVGGYAGSDSWRINSGVTSIYKEGESVRVGGHSGSCYVINTSTHMTGYGQSVINRIIKRASEEGIVVEMVDLDEVVLYVN